MRKLVHSMWKLRYLLVAVMLAGAVPALAQDSGQAAKTAGETYKNVQVLKDIPAPQLKQTMLSFSHSLGVKCNFCHVEGAFDKDDKMEKQTARAMIKMAQGINKDNFGGERKVSCWTCHRGATEPETKPPQTEQPK